jgi:ammonia channel protein AmtB
MRCFRQIAILACINCWLLLKVTLWPICYLMVLFILTDLCPLCLYDHNLKDYSSNEVLDFAGGTVVHMSAGLAALAMPQEKRKAQNQTLRVLLMYCWELVYYGLMV